jgi:hypothetical protein
MGSRKGGRRWRKTGFLPEPKMCAVCCAARDARLARAVCCVLIGWCMASGKGRNVADHSRQLLFLLLSLLSLLHFHLIFLLLYATSRLASLVTALRALSFRVDPLLDHPHRTSTPVDAHPHRRSLSFPLARPPRDGQGISRATECRVTSTTGSGASSRRECTKNTIRRPLRRVPATTRRSARAIPTRNSAYPRLSRP